MKLSKKLTTVTPLSKKKAIILIILFLFLGFYLGIKYQEIKQIIESPIPTENETIIEKTSPEQIDCEKRGGYWWPNGPFGEKHDPACQFTASDSGKLCNNGSECSSGYCVSDSSQKSQRWMTAKGKCSEHEYVYGCVGLVNYGIVESVCID